MELSGSQAKFLHKALLSAFPNQSSLAQMVRFHLNENLASIDDGDNQRNRIFSLIEWAEAGGMLTQLIEGAIEENPQNSLLREWIKEYEQQSLDDSVLDKTSRLMPGSDEGSDGIAYQRLLISREKRELYNKAVSEFADELRWIQEIAEGSSTDASLKAGWFSVTPYKHILAEVELLLEFWSIFDLQYASQIRTAKKTKKID